jgi:hypothetical protein
VRPQDHLARSVVSILNGALFKHATNKRRQIDVFGDALLMLRPQVGGQGRQKCVHLIDVLGDHLLDVHRARP